MSVSYKSYKKIGFFSALAMLVGSVVGIGIFFRNGTIAKATEFDGISWLMTWIVGGLIAIAMAFSFSEVGRIKINKLSGLSNAALQTGGKKFGYLTSIWFSLFFMAVLTAAASVFVGEFLLMAINSSSPNFLKKFSNRGGIVCSFLIGFSLFAFLLTLTRVSLKTSGIIQQATVVLKFLPLLIAATIGLVAVVKNSGTENQIVSAFATTEVKKSRFLFIVAALPSALFAFDGFLGVLTLTNRVKDGERKVPLVVVLGMLIVTGIYLFVAIASVLTKQSSIPGLSELIEKILPKATSAQKIDQVKKGISSFVFWFVFISGFGLLNGITSVYNSEITNQVNLGMYAFSRKAKNKWGLEKASLIWVCGVYLLYWSVLFIVSLVANNDQYLDGWTNFPTIFMFAVYALVIVFYAKNRNKFTHRKINSIVYYSLAFISVLGVLAFEMSWIYQLFASLKSSGGKTALQTQGWGGIFENEQKISALASLMTSLLALVWFLGLPIINYYALLRFDKVNVETILQEELNKIELLHQKH